MFPCPWTSNSRPNFMFHIVCLLSRVILCDLPESPFTHARVKIPFRHFNLLPRGGSRQPCEQFSLSFVDLRMRLPTWFLRLNSCSRKPKVQVLNSIFYSRDHSHPQVAYSYFGLKESSKKLRRSFKFLQAHQAGLPFFHIAWDEHGFQTSSFSLVSPSSLSCCRFRDHIAWKPLQ